jgi:hypothetical protein
MSLYRVWTLVVSQLLLATAMVRADYPQNPLLINDSVYVSQQGVYRFDRNQSEPLWSSLSGIQTFAPVVFENRLLVGSTRGLYALDLESGAIVWQIEEKRTLFTPSISTQAYAGSVHGELYAIAIHATAQSTGDASSTDGYILRPSAKAPVCSGAAARHTRFMQSISMTARYGASLRPRRKQSSAR